MTITAVILLLLSAAMHAGWNLLGKRNTPVAASFLVACLVGILCLAPFPILYPEAVGAFSPRAWLLVGITGFFQTVYYASLAGAYKAGDMSIAYPLARSMPVIAVTIISFLLGRGDQVSRQCIYGIILVVGGGCLLPMKRFGDVHLSNYLNVSTLLALAAALGTTGYSMIDDETLRLLREAPNASLQSWQITLVYAFFEALASTCWLILFVCGRKHGRKALRQIVTQHFASAALMGIGIYLTYSLVLISMAFVTNVSYVVAFRQLSIPLGVVFSVFILKEPANPPKFVAVTIMFLGLLLVGTG